MNREDSLSSLTDSKLWDVAVIGGGATGLGAALEAASRGYQTVLLEAADFAKGTSSRSTKLIHGGVRYLRSGQVSLVRESLRERQLLLRNAPHLVQPIRFAIPSFRRGARWYYFAGLRAYDLLAGKNGLEKSRLLSTQELVAQLPTVVRTGLHGGVSYADCQFDDARLAIALAQTIVEQGGVVLNYAKVTGMANVSARLKTVTFVDVETGQDHDIQTRAIVNATGVFADSIMKLDASDTAEARPRIIPSQGSHLVLSRQFLPNDCGMMIPETDDGRVLFAIPWYGRTLLGTTDQPVDHVSLEPKPSDSEIDYLLEHASRYLQMPPRRSDVLSTFSGLRPLVGQVGDNGSTSSISREHHLHTSPAGIVSIIGGKWTTYRKMGQDVIDLAARSANLPECHSKTPTLRLHGCTEPSTDGALSDTDALSMYGSDAVAIRQSIVAQPSSGKKLHDRLPFVEAQVIWAVRHEMARTVEDVLSRRLRALLLDAKAARDSAPRVAELMQAECGMSQEWRQSQVDSFTALTAAYEC